MSKSLRYSVSIQNLNHHIKRRLSSNRLKRRSVSEFVQSSSAKNQPTVMMSQFVVLFHQNAQEAEVQTVVQLIELHGSITQRYGLMPYDVLAMLDQTQATTIRRHACVANVQRW